MGMIGSPAFRARWKPPFLRGSMLGSLDKKRVPSGNIHIDVLVDIMCFAATSMERMALALFPLSIKIVPDIDIKGPRGVN
jgi:hypothetical protein